MSTLVQIADLPLLERAVRHFKGVEAGEAFARTPGALAFVAFDGEEIQGWCWGYHLPRPDASSMLYLHELDVEAVHRRKGIGRDLLRAFIAEGSKLGATRMFLSTGADNAPARSLYESMGGGLAAQGPTVNYWFLLDR